MMKRYTCDRLAVNVCPTRDEMGRAAARDIKREMLSRLREKPVIRMIFAAAPSQNEVLAALTRDKEIPWERVHAFHMDEYIGLPAGAPQAFGNFLSEHIFGRVPFGRVAYIDASAKDAEAECARYASLLAESPIDIVVMGIGENGHIAFNDPPVADFSDPLAVKPVALDEICRRQQVNDGCFASLDEVPRTAITLTVPTLLSGGALFCIVPAKTKAVAVKSTLTGEIGEWCPATSLRRHPHATPYLDGDSSALWEAEG